MTDIYNRTQIIDQNFTNFVRQNKFPQPAISWQAEQVGLDRVTAIDLFESQLISRHLDLQARILKQQNHSYYTIGSSGHEGNAVLGKVFHYQDLAFLHYRDCAFLVQRSKQVDGIDIIRDLMLSFVASSEDPISGGRHKVLGSHALYVPPQTSTIASHLPKAVGTAFSLPLAKSMGIKAQLPEESVILCSFGDASANHSTAVGALNTMQWIAHKKLYLPLVMICEDNGFGISVETPTNWIEQRFGHCEGVKYIQCDGTNLPDIYRAAREAESYVRAKRKPVFFHMKTVRLMGHAGSDIELYYRSVKEVESMEFHDPLLHTARFLRENDFLSIPAIIEYYENIRQKIAKVAMEVLSTPKLSSAREIMASIVPPLSQNTVMPLPKEAERKQCFDKDYKKLDQKGTLSSLLNLALTDLMLQYPNALIFGEDVSRKGGVYHITAGLSKKFGLRRVFNTLLDEQTILGMAMGLGHNGFLPIPEIQFLAYLHNAEDQLRGEAATLSFFSKGQFQNPMVIRIAAYAYQKGFGGHFHNDNSIAVLRDIPGVIIASPSNGSDAVKMLRSCVALAAEKKRVVVFLEPIALYNVRDLHQAGDNQWMENYPVPTASIAPGEFAVYGTHKKFAIISYANGYYLSRQAAQELKDQHDIDCKVIDLRWIAPIDQAALARELTGCESVLIVDECRKTGSLSEALVTMLVEQMDPLPRIKRVTGHDSFIPLGEAWKYVLPDKERILKAAVELVRGK